MELHDPSPADKCVAAQIGKLILNSPIAKPHIVEQQRIADILDAQDERIRAEEAYRDKLKLQKKGLIEDLLTGRVRVPADRDGEASR